jgi:DNA-binding CsgD family transcriptional regulator/PAS domain-containing protein
VATGGGPPPSGHELGGAFSAAELPLLLIDLQTLTVSAANRAALQPLGVGGASVVGHPVLDLVDPADRPRAAQALGALRDGVIDFYRARRRLGPHGSTPEVATAWVRAVDFDDGRAALAEIAAGTSPAEPLVTQLGRDPGVMVVGTTDAAWTVTAVSAEVETLLGPDAPVAVGRSLLDAVDPAERDRVVAADRWAAGQMSVLLHVSVVEPSGQRRPVCCILSGLEEAAGRCFLLMEPAAAPSDAGASRAAQLEQHMWRIAAEVEASGILQRVGAMPDPAAMPELRALTTRQWEVLSRLARGERVPTIAREMAVSQSTVRNHLAAIFERFGVHSQAELLARMTGSAKPV